MLSQRKHIILSIKKYCDLDEKLRELELQCGILWDSNSHPSKAKETSTPTIQGCGKCYNLDLNAYSTNLANMEAMRKEIARLNEIIGKECMDDKAQTNDKKDEPNGAQYKKGRHPSIKLGQGHTTGAKTNGRKIVIGYEFVQFERKDRIGTDLPTHTMAVSCPAKNGKATHSVSDQTKPMKKVSQ